MFRPANRLEIPRSLTSMKMVDFLDNLIINSILISYLTGGTILTIAS